MFSKVLLHSYPSIVSWKIGGSIVRSFSESSPTLFEKIASKQIPSTLLYEDDKVLSLYYLFCSVVRLETVILVLQLIFLLFQRNVII